VQAFLRRARRYQSLSFAGAEPAAARRIILLEVRYAVHGRVLGPLLTPDDKPGGTGPAQLHAG
jgi:hypothetical protein